jgi:hypothetical protein
VDLAQWTASRERAARARVRLAGLCLAGALAVVAVWLGWREVRLAPLPGYVREGVRAEDVIETRLRLKELSTAIHLAKVRRGSLLKDITGDLVLSAPCMKLGDLRGVDSSSPCAVAWDDALARIWAAAYGPDAPPPPAWLARDRWGSPYLLDQSEALCGLFGPWCPHDVVSSAGPDGKPDTDDDLRETNPQFLGPALLVQP